MRSRRLIQLGLAAAFSSAAYLVASSPGKVVIDDGGQIIGLSNQVRSIVQSTRFWRNQLAEIDSEIRWRQSEPLRLQKSVEQMNQSLKNAERIVEEFYERNPTTRPTAAEREAEALRERADEIERAEFDRLLGDARLQRLDRLHRIRPTVAARAHEST